MNYSTGFKNSVLKKVLPPENRSISEVSKETGVSDQTIRNWLKVIKDDNFVNFLSFYYSNVATGVDSRENFLKS